MKKRIFDDAWSGIEWFNKIKTIECCRNALAIADIIPVLYVLFLKKEHNCLNHLLNLSDSRPDS